MVKKKIYKQLQNAITKSGRRSILFSDKHCEEFHLNNWVALIQ